MNNIAVTQKPERADKTRNRARILEAASAAFAEFGVEAQMDDVAARAGLGVGTLYRHFATKEALVGAMIRERFALILDLARAGLEREGEPFAVVKDVLRGGAGVCADDVAAQDALMAAGDEAWRRAGDILEELQATMQVLIDRAQAAGTMRLDFDSADVSMIMCGVSATMSVDGWDWQRHLEILLDGLAAPGAR
ncbi:MAG TPA: helix-turn-helix domain-containing protein [Solirubrobacteraceae bacterium]|nr:helix-turn-helix domain-containing protein [Solirubrobacteraceae bacterium]